MMKLLGACIILFSTTLIGIRWAERYVRRPREIRLLRSSLLRLESEIHYGATPLPTALASVAAQTQGTVGRIFHEIAIRLEKEGHRPLYDCWQEGIHAAWSMTSMKSTEQSVLLQFGRTLGSTDREDQVKHIRMALSHLAAEEENAVIEQQKNEKLCRSLGMLAGALAVILMY
jgi:stage III sporulation protein AB